jgi:hypothetical protein
MVWSTLLRRILLPPYLILAYTGTVGAAPLQCDIGPITKSFGSVPWLVYSCADGKSLVVVSTPGSQAARSTSSSRRRAEVII